MLQQDNQRWEVMRGSIIDALVLASSLILLSGCGGGGGGGGPPNDSGQIPPPAPTTPIVVLRASQSEIFYWEATELSWTAQGATSCDATGGWTGSRPVSGSEDTARLTNTTTYNLTCTNGAGSASATITITVTPTISVDVVEAVRQAYQDRFGLSVPRPAIVPSGQTNQPGRIWTSTAYIDSNVYRLYGYSDGTIESSWGH